MSDEFVVEGLMDQFDVWLESNTDLLPRSKRQYKKVVACFLREHNNSTALEDINKFLTEKKISFYRFPFKFFLQFLNKEDDYHKLIKIRRKPRSRYGIYTVHQKIFELIKKIEDPIYHVVALIQYYTGARPQDVLSLEKKDFELKGDGLIIYFGRSKGMKGTVAKLPFPEANEISTYIIDSQRKFPFLKGNGTEKDLTLWIDNNYRYYLTEIQRITKDLSGLEKFRPHDFRRNLAADIYAGTKDIFYVKEILGHRNIETTVRYLEGIKKQEETKKVIEKFRRDEK